MGEEHRDFFISYTSADRTWVEWIAWELEAVGYTTLIQAWDFRPGTDWAIKMQEGTTEWSRILAVLSPRFFESKFTSAEWSSAFAKDPTGELGLLIPVRVAECEPPGLLRARTYVDLVGQAEDAVRKKLLDGVKQGRAKPAKAPSFPGSAKPKPEFPPTKKEAERQTKEETSQQAQTAPAAPRTIHNLPFSPNPMFTGREAELEALRRGLQERWEVAVTQTIAVHGLGGVGKTQLAVQYAWQHLREFDAVLWTRAESPQTFEASLAILASVLRLPEAKEREQSVQLQSVLGWLADHDRWLLIADNADTDEAARALCDRLPPSLPGQVLITSRISDWPVNIQDIELDLLSPDDATRYLLDRVARRRHNAGDEVAAGKLAAELGNLPLALEHAASFLIEMRVSFERYLEYLSQAHSSQKCREARPEVLSYVAEGGTRCATSVAKTWSITLERLSPLSHALLRLAAWFAPEAIPRGIFAVDKALLSEALNPEVHVSDLGIDEALGELDRFSLIRLTRETVSVHRLLQAVEQDSLNPEECRRWLVRTIQLFNAFAPRSPDNVSAWDVWVPIAPHAETLLRYSERECVDVLPIAVTANQLGQFLHARGAYAEAEPLYKRALSIREKSLGPEHPDLAISLSSLARLYRVLDRYGEAEPLYKRALKIQENALIVEHPDLATSLYGLGRLYAEQGRYSEAEPLYQRSRNIREKALDPEHPDLAASLYGLATLYVRLARYAEAEELFQRARMIEEKALGSEHPDLARSLVSLAELYQVQGQYAEAEEPFRRAGNIEETALDPQHPDVARSFHGLAGLDEIQGRYGQAEPFYQRAMAIREKALSPEHPDLAWSLDGLGALYKVQRQYGKAELFFERAVAIREKVLGLEHPDLAWSLDDLGALYQAQRQYAKAEPLYQEARAIREKALGLEHSEVAQSLHNLAGLYYAQGKYAKAEPLYELAVGIRQKSLGPEHPDVAWSLNSLALLYNRQSRYAEAEPLFRRALAIQEKALGPEHPDVATALENYAVLLRETGRLEEAASLESRAKAIQTKRRLN